MSYDHTIKKGTTSKIIEIMLRDSATGQGKTGLATGDMGGAYVREGGTHVSLSFSAGSAGDAYSSGKWAEVDATNMAGVYQYHLPDLALASGVDAVTIRFSATGVIDKVVRISLIDVDLRDASNAGLSDVSAILVDTGTTLPASIAGLNDFDPATDTVANVTTVGSVTSAVTTDAASRSASQADLSSVASAASVADVDAIVDAIKLVTDKLDDTLALDGAVYQFTTNALENAPSGSGGGGDSKEDIYTYFTTSSRQDTFKADVSTLSTFDAGSDTVTVSQNNDKTGYSISGTKTTLDALNDIAATSIVSGGAINTSAGAVSTVNNVVLCATTTTNTDMRGTDSALLASAAPANWSSFVLDASGRVTVITNSDKTGYSISGTKTTLDDLTDISAAQVNAQVDTALSDIGLDHLVSASVTGTDVADNSIIARMVSSAATADWDTFANTDDSLQAIRDRGDSAWTPSGGLTAADIADAVLDEALTGHTTAGSLGKAIADIESDVTLVLEDTAITIPTSITGIDNKIDTIDANVDAVLVDTGSDIPATLTTITGKIDGIDTNVDAVLLDTGTTIPATLAGLSTLDAAGVRSAVGMTNADLDAQLGTIDTNVDSVLEDTGTTLPAAITALNDLDAAGVRAALGVTSPNLDTQLSTIDSNVDSVLEDTGTTIPAAIDAIPVSTSEIAAAVWDSSVSSHNAAGSFGRGFRQVKEGLISYDGQVDDASATTTSFVTNLVSAVDDFYNEKTIVFTGGDLEGQSRVITDYNGTSKTITVEEAFTSAPADGSDFIILTLHVHPVSELIDAVWDEQRAGHTTAGSFGYYLDSRVSQAAGGGGASASDIWGALLSDHQVAGTFGARFQTADRYTNTTAQIIYLEQGDAYDDTANEALEWSVTKDYSGADSLTITIEHRVTGVTLLTHTVTYIDASTLKAYLSSADTAFSALTTDADFGVHPYKITADYAGETDTVVKGAASIRKG